MQISGSDPFSYHVINVLIHFSAAILMFFIVRRLLEWGGVDRGCARRWRASARLLFLLHPVQTEAVAYLAGRSESLSSTMVFAAFAVFLYRRAKAA